MISKGKSKAFTGAAGLFMGLFVLTIYWPQVTGRSQQPPIQQNASYGLDSVAILEAQARRSDSIALSISRELPAQARKLARMIRRPATNQAHSNEPSMPTLAIRYQGEVYEIDPEVYRGYWIVDIDKLQAEFTSSDSIADMPATVEVIVQHADEQITGWQRIKAFLKKTFRKNK